MKVTSGLDPLTDLCHHTQLCSWTVSFTKTVLFSTQFLQYFCRSLRQTLVSAKCWNENRQWCRCPSFFSTDLFIFTKLVTQGRHLLPVIVLIVSEDVEAAAEGCYVNEFPYITELLLHLTSTQRLSVQRDSSCFLSYFPLSSVLPHYDHRVSAVSLKHCPTILNVQELPCFFYSF